MKIAVPVKADQHIDGHFGHCASYQIFTIGEAKEIVARETMDSPQGCGCKSNIASVFKSSGVTVMLAGGIGSGAINKLAEQGIEVIRNCDGLAEEQVIRYLAGELVDGGSSCAAHEHHHGSAHEHQNGATHEHHHTHNHVCSHQ